MISAILFAAEIMLSVFISLDLEDHVLPGVGVTHKLQKPIKQTKTYTNQRTCISGPVNAHLMLAKHLKTFIHVHSPREGTGHPMSVKF